MSFPRYAEYRDSGVEWLGEVPAPWRLKPLWSLFRRTKRDGFQDELLLSVYRDFGVVPKASRDDNFNKPSDDLSAYQLVQIGDLAINKMKAWQGSVAISDFRGIVSPAYFVYQAEHQECARYLHYLMRSDRYITAYMSLSKGIRVNQWDLEPAYHSRMAVLLPSVIEQTAIAAFLDRETAKIDALVAEQETLIALLKEKRQAVISHAVTKGLNPDAPMKPSGIEWLGDVPAHWAVRRVKNMSVLLTSGPRGWSERISDDGAKFIQSGDLKDGLRVDYDGAARVLVVIDAESQRSRLSRGDVVVCITGAKTGNVAVCGDTGGDAYINQHLCLIRLMPEIDSVFLGNYLKSAQGQTYFEQAQYGLKQGLSLENVKEAVFPVPPFSEQIAIVSRLNALSADLDQLVREAERTIILLKERRSALISAAVTGQIDVRNWSATENP